jgi:hypothetical protein
MNLKKMRESVHAPFRLAQSALILAVVMITVRSIQLKIKSDIAG